MICEYNAVFGDILPISIPYDEAFVREVAHASCLYWGASIAAIAHWAERRGYVLLGSNRAGNNAFLVRKDLAERCFPKAPTDRSPLPSRYRESRRRNHAAGYGHAPLQRALAGAHAGK